MMTSTEDALYGAIASMGDESAPTLMDAFASCQKDSRVLSDARRLLDGMNETDRTTFENAFDAVGRLGGGLDGALALSQATMGICRRAAFAE